MFSKKVQSLGLNSELSHSKTEHLTCHAFFYRKNYTLARRLWAEVSGQSECSLLQDACKVGTRILVHMSALGPFYCRCRYKFYQPCFGGTGCVTKEVEILQALHIEVVFLTWVFWCSKCERNMLSQQGTSNGKIRSTSSISGRQQNKGKSLITHWELEDKEPRNHRNLAPGTQRPKFTG